MSTRRRCCAPGRAARMATTSRTARRSTPSWAAWRASSASAMPCRRTACGCCWTSCPTTWAIGADNAWWMDVLAHGQASATPRWFDIDWTRGRLVLPALGRRLAGALEDGELDVALDDDGRVLAALLRASLRARSGHAGAGAGARRGACEGRAASRGAAGVVGRACRAAAARAGGRRTARGRSRGAAGTAASAARRLSGGERGAVRRPGGGPFAGADRGPARRAGLAAHVLARRVRRDQLPPLLRRQRAGRAAHGGARGVRGDARARARPGRGRPHRRPAHRPSRRPARSGAIFRPAAGGLRAPGQPTRRDGVLPLYVVGEKIEADGETLPRWPCTAPPATGSPTR